MAGVTTLVDPQPRLVLSIQQQVELGLIPDGLPLLHWAFEAQNHLGSHDQEGQAVLQAILHNQLFVDEVSKQLRSVESLVLSDVESEQARHLFCNDVKATLQNYIDWMDRRAPRAQVDFTVGGVGFEGLQVHRDQLRTEIFLEDSKGHILDEALHGLVGYKNVEQCTLVLPPDAHSLHVQVWIQEEKLGAVRLILKGWEPGTTLPQSAPLFAAKASSLAHLAIHDQTPLYEPKTGEAPPKGFVRVGDLNFNLLYTLQSAAPSHSTEGKANREVVSGMCPQEQAFVVLLENLWKKWEPKGLNLPKLRGDTVKLLQDLTSLYSPELAEAVTSTEMFGTVVPDGVVWKVALTYALTNWVRPTLFMLVVVNQLLDAALAPSDVVFLEAGEASPLGACMLMWKWITVAAEKGLMTGVERDVYAKVTSQLQARKVASIGLQRHHQLLCPQHPKAQLQYKVLVHLFVKEVGKYVNKHTALVGLIKQAAYTRTKMLLEGCTKGEFSLALGVVMKQEAELKLMVEKLAAAWVASLRDFEADKIFQEAAKAELNQDVDVMLDIGRHRYDQLAAPVQEIFHSLLQSNHREWPYTRLPGEAMQALESAMANMNDFLQDKKLSMRRAEVSMSSISTLHSLANEDTLVVYKVAVYTSKKARAGTDANVYIELHGDSSSSGRVALSKDNCTIKNKNLFERGQMDVFIVATRKLGNLQTLKICHDGSGFGSDWHLTMVEVLETNHNKTWFFECNSWLSKSRGQSRERMLSATAKDPRSKQIDYKVVVKTADLDGAGTDSNISIMLSGSSGDSEKIQLKGSSVQNLFERDRKDEFTITSLDVGDLETITVESDGRGIGSSWHCEEIRVIPMAGQHEMQEYVFEFNQLFTKEEGLSHSRSANDEKDMVDYLVLLNVGRDAGAGGKLRLYITLSGEFGTTNPQPLTTNKDGKEEDKVHYEQGERHEFKVHCRDIGAVQSIILRTRHMSSMEKGLKNIKGYFTNMVGAVDKDKDDRVQIGSVEVIALRERQKYLFSTSNGLWLSYSSTENKHSLERSETRPASDADLLETGVLRRSIGRDPRLSNSGSNLNLGRQSNSDPTISVGRRSTTDGNGSTSPYSQPTTPNGALSRTSGLASPPPVAADDESGSISLLSWDVLLMDNVEQHLLPHLKDTMHKWVTNLLKPYMDKQEWPTELMDAQRIRLPLDFKRILQEKMSGIYSFVQYIKDSALKNTVVTTILKGAVAPEGMRMLQFVYQACLTDLAKDVWQSNDLDIPSLAKEQLCIKYNCLVEVEEALTGQMEELAEKLAAESSSSKTSRPAQYSSNRLARPPTQSSSSSMVQLAVQQTKQQAERKVSLVDSGLQRLFRPMLAAAMRQRGSEYEQVLRVLNQFLKNPNSHETYGGCFHMDCLPLARQKLTYNFWYAAVEAATRLLLGFDLPPTGQNSVADPIQLEIALKAALEQELLFFMQHLRERWEPSISLLAGQRPSHIRILLETAKLLPEELKKMPSELMLDLARNADREEPLTPYFGTECCPVTLAPRLSLLDVLRLLWGKGLHETADSFARDLVSQKQMQAIFGLPLTTPEELRLSCSLLMSKNDRRKVQGTMYFYFATAAFSTIGGERPADARGIDTTLVWRCAEELLSAVLQGGDDVLLTLADSSTVVFDFKSRQDAQTALEMFNKKMLRQGPTASADSL